MRAVKTKTFIFVRRFLWAVIAVVTLVPLNLQAQQPSSSNRLLFSSQGSNFVGAVACDFNNDGAADAVLCDQAKNAVVVLFNPKNPSSQFAPVSIELQDLVPLSDGSFTSLDCGDVDKNGKLDVVVTASGENSLVIVIYQIGGSTPDDLRFAIRAFPSGPDPTAVKLADLGGVPDLANGGKPTPPDGAPEILMLNQRIGSVTALINNGIGIFGLGRVTETGAFGPSALTLGDFDDDGLIDAAVLNQGNGPAEDSVISVLFGSGDGSFRKDSLLIPAPRNSVSISAVGYGVVSNGRQIDTPDFNRDGVTDLVVTAEAGGGASPDITAPDGSKEAASVRVYLGDPARTGKFLPSATSVALESSTPNDGRIGIFPGATDSRTNRPAGSAALVLTDLNQNGQPDCVIGGRERNNGKVTSNTVGPVANDFAGAAGVFDLGVDSRPPNSARVLPSDTDDARTIRAKAPDDLDAVTSVASTDTAVVSKTGEIISLLKTDFDPGPGNVLPDVVQATSKGRVYLSVNVTSVLNHAPVLTTSRGLGDFNGAGRKILTGDGQEIKITLKAFDLDPSGAFQFSLVKSPQFVSVTDNKDGTATLSIKPTAADGSTENGGLGKAYDVVAQVSDGDFRLPLTARLSFRVFVKPGSTPAPSVTVSEAGYGKKQLTVSGSGFGANPTLMINGKAMSSEAGRGMVSDTKIVMNGNMRALGLQKGDNTVQVIHADGQKSNVLTFSVKKK